ncbi:hypothetical protein SAMN04488564_112151 [Lentzea waywayandensis]|uniref:Peptidase inhibitor family I36 n=1 Tax=Lentzea waywayandensis TaxID=84724 RepID=A0A1I6FDN5_9PSEU|nr:hypothetical protein [Lentzea waywayandensis]SFR28040.1 hypothetical protein SAMN04488564_112151 [Lentzea waywayandensis]
MRTGKFEHKLRTAGVVVAALGAVLTAGQPATADPGAMAVRSCTVTTQWTCVTAPLWVGSGANPHIATANIPWTAPYEPGTPDPVNSFVLVRYLDGPGDPEILRDNKRRGNEHDVWGKDWKPGNYRAELHCPYSCQGASLYFAN